MLLVRLLYPLYHPWSLYRVQMSYKELRTTHEPRVTNLYGFSSAKKMASVLVRTDEGFRLYNKVMLPPCLLPGQELPPSDSATLLHRLL